MVKKSTPKNSDKIVLRFKYRYDDYLKVNREHLRRQLYSSQYLGWVLLATVLAVGILLFGLSGSPTLIITVTVLFTIIICSFLFILSVNNAAIKKLKKDKSILNEPAEFSFSRDGIIAQIGKSRFMITADWEAFPKMIEYKESFFIQNRKGSFGLLVPKRIFSDTQEKALVNIVTQNQEGVEAK